MRALILKDKKLKLAQDYPVPKPVPGEALIRVLMAGICHTDLELARGYMGFSGVLGHEFVGIVESSSNKALRGGRVVGEINCGCGQCRFCRRGLARHCPRRTVLGIYGRNGAFAEYLTLPEANLHLVPPEVSDEAAVFTEPLAAGYEIIEQLHIGPQDRALILGDGKLGQLIAQALKPLGCELLVSGKHPEKLKLLEKQGITVCMVEELLEKVSHGLCFDIVVEATGSLSGIEQALGSVVPRGKIVLKTTVAEKHNLDLSPLVIQELSLIGSRCGPFPPALRALAAGWVSVAPLIEQRFPLEQAKQALDYAARKGSLKVLLRINSTD